MSHFIWEWVISKIGISSPTQPPKIAYTILAHSLNLVITFFLYIVHFYFNLNRYYFFWCLCKGQNVSMPSILLFWSTTQYVENKLGQRQSQTPLSSALLNPNKIPSWKYFSSIKFLVQKFVGGQNKFYFYKIKGPKILAPKFRAENMLIQAKILVRKNFGI